MFGFIVANGKALDEAQLARYRGCYCGLCRTLKERHGNLSRLTLNYDMTFLILLLTAMYEPEERAGEGRCVVHPARRRGYWRSRFTDYAADMNVALAYHNCLDDYRDEKRLLGLAEARQLKRHYDKVREQWPVQCGAIERRLEELTAIENAPAEAGEGPDAAANCFGALMGTLFACEPDPVWQPHFRRFGEALGRFLYMMDACVDLERDRKRGTYNPLINFQGELTEAEKTGMLKMLIGECAAEFEVFPILRDANILRNILYSGVWTQYAQAIQKKRKGDDAPDGERPL